MKWSIDVMERGWAPDAVVRAGIRALDRRRLRLERRGNPEMIQVDPELSRQVEIDSGTLPWSSRPAPRIRSHSEVQTIQRLKSCEKSQIEGVLVERLTLGQTPAPRKKKTR